MNLVLREKLNMIIDVIKSKMDTVKKKYLFEQPFARGDI